MTLLVVLEYGYVVHLYFRDDTVPVEVDKQVTQDIPEAGRVLRKEDPRISVVAQNRVAACNHPQRDAWQEQGAWMRWWVGAGGRAVCHHKWKAGCIPYVRVPPRAHGGVYPICQNASKAYQHRRRTLILCTQYCDGDCIAVAHSTSKALFQKLQELQHGFTRAGLHSCAQHIHDPGDCA
eukprot:6260121-Prymnesium_polylepis.2